MWPKNNKRRNHFILADNGHGDKLDKGKHFTAMFAHLVANDETNNEKGLMLYQRLVV